MSRTRLGRSRRYLAEPRHRPIIEPWFPEGIAGKGIWALQGTLSDTRPIIFHLLRSLILLQMEAAMKTMANTEWESAAGWQDLCRKTF